jgi:hypothetical protein
LGAEIRASSISETRFTFRPISLIFRTEALTVSKIAVEV